MRALADKRIHKALYDTTQGRPSRRLINKVRNDAVSFRGQELQGYGFRTRPMERFGGSGGGASVSVVPAE